MDHNEVLKIMADRKVVVVGCGLIGSYHIMGALRASTPLRTQGVDINREAIRNAQAKIAGALKGIERLEFDDDLDRAWAEPDLTIVATLATNRCDVIRQLLKGGHRRFLVEKMVCQSAAEYQELLGTLKQHGAKAWVNTIRRYNDVYRTIAERLGPGPITLDVVAHNIGLGSNAIHYLDLLAMFGRRARITLHGDRLDRKLYANKRGQDLLELAGLITGETSEGDRVSVCFLPMDTQLVCVRIASADAHAVVDELNRKACLWGTNQGGEWAQFDYREPRVSEATPQIVDEVLRTDTCSLPTLEEAFDVHDELFRIFNAHLKRLRGRAPEMCPVT
jgi:hypothetical protein